MENHFPDFQESARAIALYPRHAEDRLASRTARLTAAILDTVINTLFSLPVIYLTGLPETLLNDQTPTVQQFFWTVILGLLVFMCTQGTMLVSRQQTIGKYFLKLKIVGVKAESVSVFRLLGLRYLLFTFIIANIPLIGSLIVLLNVLLIFRQSRMCLHDTVARTRVIDIG